MKKVLIIAALALFISSSAQADGQFSGPYVGVNLGGSHANFNETGFGPYACPGGTCYQSLLGSLITNPNTTNNGVTGGGQVGYNWQTGKYVLGVEAELNGVNLHIQTLNPCSTPAPHCASNVKMDSFGIVRARFGYAFLDNLIGYISAGPAISHGNADFSPVEVPSIYGPPDSSFGFGWAAGIGAEYKIASAIGIKGEYLHIQTTSRYNTADAAGAFAYGIRSVADQDMGRVGVNYYFK